MIAILLLVIQVVLVAQKPPSREYQLKAAFLFNFSQFVEWPESSFTSDNGPLVIGVVGENPFGGYLAETVSGEKVNNHPLIIRYYSNPEEIKNCHILFINLTDAKKIERITDNLKGQAVLTVSDAPDFAKYGGMIKFFTRDNKIKFLINHEAAKAANLVISSKLLRLAEIYQP